jgi:hypothetical protein
VAGDAEATRRVLRDLEELQGSNKGAATQVYFMVCWVKLIGRLPVWKKRTVIASPSFCSPACNGLPAIRPAPPGNAGKVEFAA